MEGILKGIEIPKPKYIKYTIPNELTKLKNYSNLKTFIPPMKQLFDISGSTDITFENDFIIKNIEEKNGSYFLNKHKEVYLKVTHLMDPIKVAQGENDKMKIQNPWNQAYVETLASYIFGKLRSENITPHFNLFYGAFSSVAKNYNFNITDEVESYRMYRWFWNNIEENKIKINVDGEDKEQVKEIYDEIMVKPDYCLDNKESDSDEIEELKSFEIKESTKMDELESIQSLDSIKTESTKESNDTSEDSDDDDDEYTVYAQFENFPVMMIFTEKNESTLDDLLEDYDEVGSEPNINTKGNLWEDTWSAWLFQIIAALCVGQTILGFTHNDLHSNNIVWDSTNVKVIYYKTNDNKIFKVPTYGKIFKIIDFGRSIFSINEHLFVSDDFCEGNDAATQYNFPPLSKSNDSPSTLVYPNSSFDLARLAISIFESIFPEIPIQKKDGAILNPNDENPIKETNSDLFNLLWSWLVDIEGKNILYDENGDERFPDFDLYVHIASKCRNCVPKEQIYKKPFRKFLINSMNIPKSIMDVKKYNLYV